MSNNTDLQSGSGDTNPGVDAPKTVTREAHLAFGILMFVAGLALFVVLYGMLDIFVADLFGPVGLEAEGTELTETQEYVAQTWNLLPFIAVVVLATRFIARAAFESRGGV
jgi:hypothetical protein